LSSNIAGASFQTNTGASFQTRATKQIANNTGASFQTRALK